MNACFPVSFDLKQVTSLPLTIKLTFTDEKYKIYQFRTTKNN